ncbi:MAG TPA: hypothetical protein VF624_07300 [Tepidisphaeraceae bacterium]
MDDELELTPVQKKISELILKTPAPGKHAARNAVIHMQRAWKMRTTDREMAAFARSRPKKNRLRPCSML